MKKIEIFTDGACSGNPGPGGYGVIMRYEKHEKELSGGYAETTNNRMELLGAIIALESLKEPCDVTVTTDSQYVVNAIEKGWAKKWRAMGWMRNKKEPALNPDLWERLLQAAERHKVRFVWIRGHNGHAENERCDKLAVDAAAKPGLPKDEGMVAKW
jgi:ribonuclease HI